MLPAGVRIFLCTVLQDMRRSFDGLALAATQLLGEDPQNGAIYVFVSKRSTRVKVLWWDRNGYCLLAMRLHRALFQLPEAASRAGPSLKIDGAAPAQLLAGVAVEKPQRRS